MPALPSCALLLLVAEYYSGFEELLNDRIRERLDTLKAIGYSPLLRLSPPATHIADMYARESQTVRTPKANIGVTVTREIGEIP